MWFKNLKIMTHLNLLKVINSFIVLFTITMRGLHFFCYLAAIFKDIEKKKYVELRIAQFVSTSKIIYFLG